MNEHVQFPLERGLSRVPEMLREPTRRYLDTLAPAIPADANTDLLERLPRVLASSDFVARSFTAQPALLAELFTSGDLLRVTPARELDQRLRHLLHDVVDEAQ